MDFWFSKQNHGVGNGPQAVNAKVWETVGGLRVHLNGICEGSAALMHSAIKKTTPKCVVEQNML